MLQINKLFLHICSQNQYHWLLNELIFTESVQDFDKKGLPRILFCLTGFKESWKIKMLENRWKKSQIRNLLDITSYSGFTWRQVIQSVLNVVPHITPITLKTRLIVPSLSLLDRANSRVFVFKMSTIVAQSCQ